METTNLVDKRILTCQILCVFVQMPHLAWSTGEFRLGQLESPLGQCMIKSNQYRVQSVSALFAKFGQNEVLRPQFVGALKNIEWAIIENIFYNIAIRGEEFVKPGILQAHIERMCKREQINGWFTAHDVYEYIKMEEEGCIRAEIAMNQ